MQAVGEFDEQNPDIARNCDKQLAEILRLLRLASDEVELLDLSQAVNEVTDVGPEQVVDLGGAVTDTTKNKMVMIPPARMKSGTR